MALLPLDKRFSPDFTNPKSPIVGQVTAVAAVGAVIALPATGGSTRELIGAREAILSGTAKQTPTGIQVNGSGNFATIEDSATAIYGASDVTIAITVKLDSLSAGQGGLLGNRQDGLGGNDHWIQILERGSGDLRFFFKQGTTEGILNAIGVFSVGVETTLVCIRRGATLLAFQDGRLIASASGKPSGALLADSDFRVGAYFNNSFVATGLMRDAVVLPYAVSDTEAVQLSRSVKTYLYEPATQPAYFIPEAASGITGSGALQSQDATTSGTATIVKTSSGALQSQDAVTSGTGVVAGAITGSGVLLSQSTTTTGTAQIVKTSSGALQSQSSTTSGTGSVGGEITGSGVLLSQSATTSGTAEIVKTGSGALQSQDSTVSGAGQIVKTSTGALQSQSSTTAGSGIVGAITRPGRDEDNPILLSST